MLAQCARSFAERTERAAEALREAVRRDGIWSVLFKGVNVRAAVLCRGRGSCYPRLGLVRVLSDSGTPAREGEGEEKRYPSFPSPITDTAISSPPRFAPSGPRITDSTSLAPTPLSRPILKGNPKMFSFCQYGRLHFLLGEEPFLHQGGSIVSWPRPLPWCWVRVRPLWLHVVVEGGHHVHARVCAGEE